MKFPCYAKTVNGTPLTLLCAYYEARSGRIEEFGAMTGFQPAGRPLAVGCCVKVEDLVLTDDKGRPLPDEAQQELRPPADKGKGGDQALMAPPKAFSLPMKLPAPVKERAAAVTRVATARRAKAPSRPVEPPKAVPPAPVDQPPAVPPQAPVKARKRAARPVREIKPTQPVEAEPVTTKPEVQKPTDASKPSSLDLLNSLFGSK